MALTKQNYRGLSAFLSTRPGNEVGLFYNTPKLTRCSHADVKSSKRPVWVTSLEVGHALLLDDSG